MANGDHLFAKAGVAALRRVGRGVQTWAVEPRDLEPEVLDQLVVEHRDRGRRAVEFLATARAHLAGAANAGPRIGQSVAFCIREALASITAVDRGDGAGRWRQLSRHALDAKTRYERALELPETADEAGEAKAALMRALDEIEEFHKSEGLRQQRLVASIVDRTGSQPHAAGMQIVQEFLAVLDAANDAAHASAELEDPVGSYNRATAVLTSLFQPPAVRFEALEGLATVPEPSDEDVARLGELVVSPLHMQRFLRALPSTRWLDALVDTGMLDPPKGRAPWPGFAAIDALVPIDPAGLAEWLVRLYRRCRRNAVQAWHILRAAQDIGEAADDLLLQVLAQHARDGSVRELALVTLLQRPAGDPLVNEIADHLLNDHGDDAWLLQKAAEALVRGIDRDNGKDRLRLLTRKLRATASEEARWHWLGLDGGGSVGDRPLEDTHTRLDVLIAALVAAANAVRAIVGTDAVLVEVDSLPAELRSRVRAWLLGAEPTTPPAVMAAEVAQSMTSRGPTVDDLTMLDRVVGALPPAEYLPGWIDALGPRPTDEQLAEVIAGGHLQPSWARAYEWLGVLPEGVRGAWSGVFVVLCEAYGTPSREALHARRPFEASFGRSPFEAGELSALAPIDAATKVGRWRPDPAEFLVGPLELARTLRAVVAADPSGWLADPVPIATVLREPIHIDHYLRGAADAIKADAHVNAEPLMDLIDLALSSPWPATAMGRSDWDFEPDWSSCRDAAIELLRAMADKSVGFAGRDEHGWATIKAATTDLARPSPSGDGDPLTAAINHPPTRALDATVSLLAYQIRTSGEAGTDVLTHLEHLLAVDGTRGALNRAIIASRLGYFVSALPDWVDSVDQILFGNVAPDGLGQLTFDLAVKWGRPSRWLLERHQPQVLDAVRRRVDNALEHVLVAYLWQCDGYSLDELTTFLASVPGLPSEAGEALGRMLRDAPTDVVRLGLDVWRAVLDTGTERSLAGFGWFAEVPGIDDVEWGELTLRTMNACDGPIAWSRGVTKRVAGTDPTTTTLAILDELVRHPEREWDAHPSAEAAAQHLQRADGLRESFEYQRLHGALAERGVV